MKYDSSLYKDKLEQSCNYQLEQEKHNLLNTLEADKEVFLGWLTTINIKHISTLNMEMLELLVSCWLASKQYCKSNNIHKQELFKSAYKVKYDI